MTAAQLSLILPTLNERQNVVELIGQLLESLPDIGEIIVVDDNSTDGTREAIREHFAPLMDKRIRIHHRLSHPGLVPSLREAVALATQPLVGWMDCDLSMPPASLKDMLEMLNKGFDLVVGSRFLPGGGQKNFVSAGKDSRLEIVLSNLLNAALRLGLGIAASDFTSGFVIVRRTVLETFQWKGQHGEYFIHLLFHAQSCGSAIAEISYRCGNRKYGKSKTFGSVRSTTLNCWRYFLAACEVMSARFGRDACGKRKEDCSLGALAPQNEKKEEWKRPLNPPSAPVQ
ncbi:MAG: glycosyltransferase [Deltaproteobacteria bacterium]|nr:glycosyltransferase [Deltaproteobacteria bacterium]